MKRLLPLFAALTLSAALATAFTQRGNAQEPRLTGVVELFTSQGCSSCPPADAILAKYAQRDDVLALSWHVDYWNYLGWQDTFSDAAFTRRQKRYGAALGARNYTPQAVVNGRAHVVGSRAGDIEALLSDQDKALDVPLSIERTQAGLRVTASAPEGAVTGDATLWIVYFEPSAEVVIERGENKGRTVNYHNVVRAVDLVGMMTDGKLDVMLPRDAIKAKGSDTGASDCALLLQSSRPSAGDAALALGPIVGAARIGAL